MSAEARDLGITWRAEASCADLWLVFDMAAPEYDEDRAKGICWHCPVIDECRAEFDALEPGCGQQGYADMVVAGETPRERWVRRTGRRGRGRPSARIRALEPAVRAVPWQERGGIRAADPAQLSGSAKGFVATQVVMMTGLSARQVRYLADHGIGPAKVTQGVLRRWTVGQVDLLRVLKDKLDDGASMQRARLEVERLMQEEVR